MDPKGSESKTVDEYTWLGSLAGLPHFRRVQSRPEASRDSWSRRLRHPVRLGLKALRHPDRLLLRLVLSARLARRNPRVVHARFLHWLSREFGVDAAALNDEYHSSWFRRSYLSQRKALNKFVGPVRSGTSGEQALRALYLLVRAARPSVVVETGVLYGASSAHILAAMAANGAGELHSIDLPHDPREPSAGFLVPGHLHRRWVLVEGDCRRELPPLLQRLRAIDCFHHDSLHTFDHMTWEYQTILPYLSQRGILSSHDVLVAHSVREIFRQNAFGAFCNRNRLQWTTFQNSGFARPPAAQAMDGRAETAQGTPRRA
jgi:cephalosporin hydroxylase